MALSWQADWREVGRFLRGFRRWAEGWTEDKPTEPKTPSDCLKQIRPICPELSRLIAASGTELNLLRSLEDNASSHYDSKLSREVVQTLADAYQVPRLLLDPLFSQRLPDQIHLLTESLATFEEVNQPSPIYGRGAIYSIPPTRLGMATDLSFGHLELKPGGYTDFHAHPGTEILFVRSGKNVQLRWEAAKVRIPIQENQFVIFHAETAHSAYNPPGSPTASIFVIRLYQLSSNSAREQILASTRAAPERLKNHEQNIKDLKKYAAALKDSKDPVAAFHKLLKHIKSIRTTFLEGHKKREIDLPELGQSLATRVSTNVLRQLRKTPPVNVADFLGLGLFFRRLQETSRKKIPFKLLHPKPPLSFADLCKLVKTLNTEPMLLYSYLFPTDPDVVAGREEEMNDVPLNLTGAGVRYRVPCCNLALGDVSLLMVELDPSKSTCFNSHAGFELAVPLGGSEIEVSLRARHRNVFRQANGNTLIIQARRRTKFATQERRLRKCLS